MTAPYPLPPSMRGKPNLPGHNHPAWPSPSRQQKMCRRGDTLLCAMAGFIGCVLCTYPQCPKCHEEFEAGLEAARRKAGLQ